MSFITFLNELALLQVLTCVSKLESICCHPSFLLTTPIISWTMQTAGLTETCQQATNIIASSHVVTSCSLTSQTAQQQWHWHSCKDNKNSSHSSPPSTQVGVLWKNKLLSIFKTSNYFIHSESVVSTALQLYAGKIFVLTYRPLAIKSEGVSRYFSFSFIENNWMAEGAEGQDELMFLMFSHFCNHYH